MNLDAGGNVVVSCYEANELLCAAALLPEDKPDPALEHLEQQVEEAIEGAGSDIVHLQLTDEQIPVLYDIAQRITAMGLEQIRSQLRVQQTLTLQILNVTFGENHELNLHEDSDDFLATAQKFTALVDSGRTTS